MVLKIGPTSALPIGGFRHNRRMRRAAAASAAGSSAGPDFITTWTGTAGGTLTVPTAGSGFNGTVTWEDSSGVIATGAFTDVDMSALTTPSLPRTSTVTCTITGTFPHIFFAFGGDKDKILTVSNWGSVGNKTLANSYYGCSNLDITATDSPSLPSGASLYRAFRGCASLNGAIGHWDTSNVLTLLEAFYDCTIFNQSLNGWDVSSVTSMDSTFANCSAYNQPMSAWDVSSVASLAGTFIRCYAFNQDISGWNTALLTNMGATFYLASAFNRDISGWNTSGVTTMQSALDGATSFDQDLGGLDITGLTGTGMQSFLNGVTMSTANYSATINGFKAQVAANSDTPANISFHGGPSNYDSSAETSHDYLTNPAGPNWTIADGGLV